MIDFYTWLPVFTETGLSLCPSLLATLSFWTSGAPLGEHGL